MKKRVYLLFMLLLLIAGCSLNEPKAPSWDTAWKVYLPLKNVTLDKIVNDSTLIADTTNGQPIIKFELKDSTDWQRVNKEDLSITSVSDSFKAEIGSIKLKQKSEVTSTPITLNELLPPELLSTDSIPPYPDRNVTPDPKELNYNFYNSAIIEKGDIYLTFHNDLFLTVDSGLTIDVYNNGTQTPVEIAKIVFNKPIEPFSVVQSNVVDLSGEKISNQFLLKYIIPIKGTDSVTVITDQMRNGTSYSVLTIENLEVSEAEAKIPEQSFSRDQNVALPQNEHKIINAKVSSGIINLEIHNKSNVHTNLEIVIPNVVQNGEPKTVNLNLEPNSLVQTSIDLAHSEILNPTDPNQPIDSLHIHIDATVSSNDSIVTITKHDGLDVNVKTSKIYFESIEGIISQITQTITPSVIDNSNMFKNISGKGLNLDDLILTLNFENQINIPITANLKIEAIHEDGGISESKIMNVNATINPSGVSPVTEIILDKKYKNPNSIVDLIAILPTKIIVSGNAFVEGRGAVSVGDGLRAKFSVESPLSYRLTDSLSFKADMDSIKKDDIDTDLRKRISEDIGEGSLHLLIGNGTPLSAAVKLVLADDSLQLGTDAIADSSKKIIINAAIEAGAVDQNGFVTSPASSEVVVKLTQKQLQLFKESPIYIQQTVTLLPTGGKKVVIRTNDKINLDAYVGIKFTVNLD